MPELINDLEGEIIVEKLEVKQYILYNERGIVSFEKNVLFEERGFSMASRGEIVILEEICKGCGLCIGTCPRSVLVRGKHLNVKGFHPSVAAKPDECVGCAMCAVVCPEVAIEVL